MQTNPEKWLRKFFLDRQITQSTGKPLYTYKVSVSEYKQLADLLRLHQERSAGWNECFILYAAEWWRREYDGGSWSWEQICSTIGKKSLSAQLRSQLVSNGFKKWKRRIHEDGQGNDFIGTVVLESGIPSGMFADKHYLSSIITEIYYALGATTEASNDDLYLIQKITGGRLPQSLQKESFYQLLLSFSIKLIQLNEQVGFAGSSQPVAVLNARDKNWRNDFPVRVNDEVTNFIDRLLADIAQEQATHQKTIKFEYYLVKEEVHWKIQAQLCASEGIHLFDNLGIPENEFEELSHRVDIYLADRKIGQGFKRQNEYGFEVNIYDGKIHAYQNSLHKPYLLDVKTFKRFAINTSDQLDDKVQQPLIFESIQIKDKITWTLTASGSCSLPNATYLLITGSTTKLIRGQWESAGTIVLDEKIQNIFEITETCEIEEGINKYRIEIGREIRSFHYEFKPKNTGILFFRNQNQRIFLGFPTVLKLRQNGVVIGHLRKGIEYQDRNGNWRTLSEGVYGKFRVRLVENGITQFCKVIRVLPEDLTFRFTIKDKSINISDGGHLDIEVTGEPGHQIKKNLNGHMINFATDRNSDERDYFLLTVTPKRNESGKPVTVKVPRPDKSLVKFQKNNVLISYSTPLFLDELYGVNLYISNLSENSKIFSLQISLSDKYIAERIAVHRSIRVPAYSNIEFELQPIKDSFLALLSVSRNVDATLHVSCEHHAILEINQFKKNLEYQTGEEILQCDYIQTDGDSAPHCFRLDLPFGKHLQQELVAHSSTGRWNLPDSLGYWFVYPSWNSDVMFRPLIHSMTIKQLSSSNSYTELHHTCLLNRDQRLAAMEKIFTCMADNFLHPDWERLSNLFDTTRHLRLATQDAFNALSNCPRALVTASFVFREELIERLSQEYSIVWQQFPVSSWLKSFQAYRNFIFNLAPEHHSIIINHRTSWLGKVLNLSGLESILEQEKGNHHKFVSKELLLHIIDQSFNGAEKQVGLRGRHRENQWPDKLKPKILELHKGLPHVVKELIPTSVAKEQQTVVYLPFVLSTASVYAERFPFSQLTSLENFRLKELIEFDENWFTDIYNRLQPYLWLNQ